MSLHVERHGRHVTREDWLARCEEAYPRVYRSLVAMGATPADAGDAVQDAVERALKVTSEIARPDGWLFVVALRRWRTVRWRSRLFVSLGDRPFGSIAPPGEDAIVLIEALGRLPERERQVITARYVLGLSQQETATALGIATGTVAATTSHAARKLRDYLDDTPKFGTRP